MEYRGAQQVREDIYAMFRGMPDADRATWGEALTGDSSAMERKLAEAAEQHECTQKIESDDVLWLNAGGEIEVMFSDVDERDIESVRRVYKTIHGSDCPLTFILTGKGNIRYLYIASRKTYMQFGYWLGPAGARPGGPGDGDGGPGLDSVLRPELCGLFDEMDQKERENWTQAMGKSADGIAEFLGEQALQYGCTQKPEGDNVRWLDASGEVELVLRVINDPTTVMPFLDVYRAIDALSPKAAYVIVEKVFVKNGTYDVFRLSGTESYLSHHNQLYVE